MKPVSIPLLTVIGALSVGFGALMVDTLLSRGISVPITGWFTTVVLVSLGAVLLYYGLPLRRYMLENEERRTHPTAAPRRTQLDLLTAFRTVLVARACAYTGAVVGGIFTGQALYFMVTGAADLVDGVAPTGAAAIAGIALAVLGVIVERWGQLPPDDPGSVADASVAP